MTIEQVDRTKLDSISHLIPGLKGMLLLLPEETQWYLLSEEKVFSTYFHAAAVLDGEILYLSDEAVRHFLESFLTQNRG